MKITIFKKLLMGFGAMLLLTFLVGGFGFYGLSGVREKTQKTLRKNIELQKRVKRIKDSLLEARRSEKNFLLSGDERHVGQVEEQITRIKKGSWGLWALRIGLEQEDEDRISTHSIAAFADEYYKGFLSVADKIKEKGHGDRGLIGTLRESVRRLEEAIKKTGQKELIIQWLAIEEHERGYRLYGEVGSIGEVQRMIATFKTYVDGAPLGASSKAELKRRIDTYWKLFMRIVLLDAGIERLQGVYSDAARRIEEMVEEISAKGEEWAQETIAETDRIFKRSGRMILTFLLLSLGLGGGLAVFLSTGISRPVRGLAEDALRIAGGDLTRTVWGKKSRDEVGELSRAFNRMVEDLRKSKEKIEAHSQALEHRIQEMTILHKIGLMTTSTLELPEVLNRFHQEIGHILDASTFYIALYDEESDELRFELCFDKGERLKRPPRKLSEQKGFSGYVLATKEPLLMRDLEEEKDSLPIKPVLHGQPARSWLGVPLIARGKAIGVLAIQSYEPQAFDERDKQLLTTIASQAAIAVDNAGLYEETRRSAQELERKVEERTEQLVRANRDLQDFTYIVSHDLRAPLVNIQGFSKRLEGTCTKAVQALKAISQGLKKGSSMENWEGDLEKLIGEMERKIPQSFDFVFKGVQKMDEMTEQLLQLSRLSTRPAARTTVDLAGMIQEIVGTMRFQIEEKGIEVVVGALPRVTCEESRINQVFSNLLSNAIKYIGDKNPAPKIEIGCRDDGDYHLFFVRDNGIGIDKENHEKIFRIFTRVGEDPVSGHGMGLAFVKKIVERHGGRIWVESEKGKGSTFYFTISKHLKGNLKVKS